MLHAHEPHGCSLDSGLSKRLNLDPDAPDEANEEGEDMDEDAGMMALMGMAGFGSTKVSALSSVSACSQRLFAGKAHRR